MNTILKIAAAAGIALATAASAHAIEINFDGPLDVDGDGVLTLEEFQPIRDLGAQFTAYDSDGNGVLSPEEYNEGVRSLASEDGSDELSDAELKRLDELTRMFKYARADRDNLLDLGTVDNTETGAIPTDPVAADENLSGGISQ